MDRRGLWLSRASMYGRAATTSFKSVVRENTHSAGVVEDADFCEKGLSAWYASRGKSLLPEKKSLRPQGNQRQTTSSVRQTLDSRGISAKGCLQQRHAKEKAQQGTTSRATSVGLGQKSVGVHRFWTFVSEALKGSSSKDPICRQFRLYPSSSTAQKDVGLSEGMIAGVRLALGDILSRTAEDGVAVVHATQRWALVKVPGFAESIKSYRRSSAGYSCIAAAVKLKKRPLSIQEVKSFLSNFQSYLQMLEKFGNSSVPSDQWPEGWKPHTSSCENQIASHEENARSEFGADGLGYKDLSARDGLVRLGPGAGRQASNAHATVIAAGCSQDGKEKKFAKTGTPKDTHLKSIVKVAKAKGRPKRPASDDDGMPPKNANTSCVRKRPASNAIELPSKKVKPADEPEAKAAPRAKCQAKAPAPKASFQKSSTPAHEGKALKHASGKVRTDQRRLCSICGCSDIKVPKSCSACTTALSAQRNLSFSFGTRVWCRGFGPAWPARINGIGFTAAEDKEPYRVRFYGDGRHAWVCESKLVTWQSRRAPPLVSVAPRWRKAMARALEEAEDDARSGDSGNMHVENTSPPQQVEALAA